MGSVFDMLLSFSTSILEFGWKHLHAHTHDTFEANKKKWEKMRYLILYGKAWFEINTKEPGDGMEKENWQGKERQKKCNVNINFKQIEFSLKYFVSMCVFDVDNRGVDGVDDNFMKTRMMKRRW